MRSADSGEAGETAKPHPALSACEREALDTVHQAMAYVRKYIHTGRITAHDKARIHDLAEVLHEVPLIIARGRVDSEREYVQSCLARARLLMAA